MCTALAAGAFTSSAWSAEAPDKPSLAAHACRNSIATARSNRPPVNGTACGTTLTCGQLPSNPLSFSGRISPRCATVLNKYRSNWADLDMSNFVTHTPGRRCGVIAKAGPSQPVVVSSNTTATFVLCTVPKSGCTNLRKLLHAIISDPIQHSTDAFGQFYYPHIADYPNIWHYAIPASPQPPTSPPPSHTHQRKLQWSRDYSSPPAVWRPTSTQPPEMRSSSSLPSSFRRTPHSTLGQQAPEHKPPATGAAPETVSPPPRVPRTIPTFVIGRNPYVRVLSGFLDKMIDNPARHDQWTFHNVNRHLKFPAHARWQASVRDFHSFVRALALCGVDAVDGHFRPAVAICTESFKYDYYLRLEEMHEWFPCWMEGLGLRGWTEGGWADTLHGRMYVGEGRHFITLNSYKTKRHLRPQWVEFEERATSGVEGLDWAWVEGTQCWWNPTNMSCVEYYDSFTRKDGAVEPGGKSAESSGAGRRVRAQLVASGGLGDDLRVAEVVDDRDAAHIAVDGGGDPGGDEGMERAAHDTHDTQAHLLWQQYYTQEVADLVYFLYSRDFVAFGYRRYVVDDLDAEVA